MARKVIHSPVAAITSWQGVNSALAEIAAAQAKLGALQADVTRRINEFRTGIESATAPDVARIAELENAVREFAIAHRNDFTGQTMKLAYGSVSFRKSSKLEYTVSASDVVSTLERLGLSACIRVTQEPIREAVRALPAETLEQIGARITTTETFGYTLTQDV